MVSVQRGFFKIFIVCPVFKDAEGDDGEDMTVHSCYNINDGTSKFVLVSNFNPWCKTNNPFQDVLKDNRLHVW